MTALFRREVRALFSGLAGWLFPAFILAAAGVFVFVNNVLTASPLFANNAVYLALCMALGCALLAMNAFPGEARQNSERILYALPLRTHDIVLGKLLALLTPVVISCGVLALYPLVLSLFSATPALGEGLSCVLALLAMGVMFTSAALFCSACARTAVSALIYMAVLTGVSYALPYAASYVAAMSGLNMFTLIVFLALMVMLFYLLSGDLLIGFAAAAVIEAPLLLMHLRGSDAAILSAVSFVMKKLSVFEELTLFMNGIFDFSALIYWLYIACLFAVLTELAVKARRQGGRRALKS